MQADGLSGQLQSLCRNGFHMNWQSALAMDAENVARLRDPEDRVIDESCRPEKEEKIWTRQSQTAFPRAIPRRYYPIRVKIPSDWKRRFCVITIKRVYDAVSLTDGTRLLIERLWPRGVKKTSLKIKSWIKDVAPSTELRQWFRHDPEKWHEFRRRYSAELRAHPDAWRPIIEAARHGTVTLIYSSHDTEHNNAVALESFLKARLPKKKALAARARATSKA